MFDPRLSLLACLALAAPSLGAEPASRIFVRDGEFEQPKVEPAPSESGGFELVMTRQMPTPGWKIHVDAVELDGEAHRIVARVTEQGPQGIVAQVIGKAELRLPLKSLPTGRYFLEIWSRRNDGPYRPAQAMLLDAR